MIGGGLGGESLDGAFEHGGEGFVALFVGLEVEPVHFAADVLFGGPFDDEPVDGGEEAGALAAEFAVEQDWELGRVGHDAKELVDVLVCGRGFVVAGDADKVDVVAAAEVLLHATPDVSFAFVHASAEADDGFEAVLAVELFEMGRAELTGADEGAWADDVDGSVADVASGVPDGPAEGVVEQEDGDDGCHADKGVGPYVAGLGDGWLVYEVHEVQGVGPAGGGEWVVLVRFRSSSCLRLEMQTMVCLEFSGPMRASTV